MGDGDDGDGDGDDGDALNVPCENWLIQSINGDDDDDDGALDPMQAEKELFLFYRRLLSFVKE